MTGASFDRNAVIDLRWPLALTSGGAWTYQRPNVAGIIEFGWWNGNYVPGLKIHFHDEAQVVFVLSGSRSFLVGNTVLLLKAGHCAYIPAGMPHTALATYHPETFCLNAYVPALVIGRAVRVLDIPDQWRQSGHCPVGELRQALQESRSLSLSSAGATLPRHRGLELPINVQRIGVLAANAGRSREAFSRQFKDDIGISPHAFRIITRLNLARQLLRTGEAPAAVAADTGFADQSHLGRAFRQAFGATPGSYRRV